MFAFFWVLLVICRLRKLTFFGVKIRVSDWHGEEILSLRLSRYVVVTEISSFIINLKPELLFSFLITQIYFCTSILKKKYIKVRVPSTSISICLTNCLAYWREYSQWHAISHPSSFFPSAIVWFEIYSARQIDHSYCPLWWFFGHPSSW